MSKNKKNNKSAFEKRKALRNAMNNKKNTTTTSKGWERDGVFDYRIDGNNIKVVPHFMNMAKTEAEKFEGFAKFFEDENLLKNDSPIQKKIGKVLGETIRTVAKCHIPFDPIYNMFSSISGIEAFLSEQSPLIREAVFFELDDLMKNHQDEMWLFLD